MRSKIALAVNDAVLNKMPFFEGADHNFLMELALCMNMVCFPPHEEVYLYIAYTYFLYIHIYINSIDV